MQEILKGMYQGPDDTATSWVDGMVLRLRQELAEASRQQQAKIQPTLVGTNLGCLIVNSQPYVRFEVDLYRSKNQACRIKCEPEAQSTRKGKE